MKIFGDDGFRDVFGSNLLNQRFLNQFFNNLNFLLKKKEIKSEILEIADKVYQIFKKN